jgi:outer membrane protein insertion porin family
MLSSAACRRPTPLPRGLWFVIAIWLGLLFARPAIAESEPTAFEASSERKLPVLRPRPDLSAFEGRVVKLIVLYDVDEKVERPLSLQHLAPGDLMTEEAVRRAMRELVEGGRHADVRAEVDLLGDGVRLRLFASVRKTVQDVRIEGGVLDSEASLRNIELAPGQEVTRSDLSRVAARLWQFYRVHGYPQSQVSGRWLAGDAPERVIVVLDVVPGPVLLVEKRTFKVLEQALPELANHLEEYAVTAGERADNERLATADSDLQQTLRNLGWHRANVTHELVPLRPARVELEVIVQPGPLVKVHFEGNRAFDASALEESLELSDEDRSPDKLSSRLRRYYQDRGYPDATVSLEELGAGRTSDLWFRIRENGRLRVVSRSFPCLEGERTARDVADEIDAFLAEALPGADDVFAAVDPRELDRSLAPSPTPGRRAPVSPLGPTHYFAKDAYDRALEHLRDLYRSEGYLSAAVGPVVVERRACSPLSMAGACRPVGARRAPPVQCPTEEHFLPAEDAVDDSVSCTEDPARGIYCEGEVILSIPIKLGPRTTLWDLEFVGNERKSATGLAEVAALELGQPASLFQLQQARRRLLDEYGRGGFAFANVEVDLELSEDHTRGRARFVISEREPVRIRGFVVRGNERTSEGVILSRLDLELGGLYQSDLVRQSEEQLGTLGVFESVTVGLEDPDVPAREKIVVITVRERPPQYVDVRPGVSTGEGGRIMLEYGHLNLWGRAIQARARVHLNYLPDVLIFEDEVRRNFGKLSTADRLERRNTLTFEFPVAKKYRLAIEGVDARDNSRDFGITKRAGIVTLTHRASRTLTLIGGSSFELNDARIFAETSTLQAYLEQNPQQARLLNVPEGRSFAVALRATGRWDRRDNPFAATRGTFLSAEAEPVVAYLDRDSAAIQLDQCTEAGRDPATCEFKSQFLKLSQRLSGYIPFNEKGLSLALSLHVGEILQLVENSSTYPDRLFFLGGSDSLRGFLQASVIPQDIADQLVAEDPNAPNDDERLTARKVVIRGGDFVINPRIELRIPLTKIFQTALFVDGGNLWRDIDNVDPTELRYAAGSGIRAETPIGPLAFDYGIKLDRRFYEEDLGAFHFSVGLF